MIHLHDHYRKLAFAAYMVLEHLLGHTRHGSVLGLAWNVCACIIKRLMKPKQERNSK